MGKIIVSDNVTLDGGVQDPAGDEGFQAGGWAGMLAANPQLGKLALDEALGAEAWLLGRRSYEWFAKRWPSRTGDLADRLNSLPSMSFPRHSKIPSGTTRRCSPVTWLARFRR